MRAELGRVGIAIGHATDAEGATGLTVIRGIANPLAGGVAVVGRATGTREIHAASPTSLSGRVDGVLLTGGSAYGLDAAAGVMRWMEERGRGFTVPRGVVPIVPAAVIFDLSPLGRFDARPTATMAYDACERASSTDVGEGSIGAGTGATVGKILGPAGAMKGGFGCALESTADGSLHLAAVAVVNALGDVRDSAGQIIAGARTSSGDFVDAARLLSSGSAVAGPRPGVRGGHNTTLAVVAASVALSRTQLGQLARAAGAALFRRITPVGTSVDGDVIFALAPIAGERSPSHDAEPATLATFEALAVVALERAIERAVRLARGREGIPGLADAGDAER